MKRKLIKLIWINFSVLVSFMLAMSFAVNDERAELDNQAEFESHFETGMSQNDVEQILSELEVEYIDESILDDGEYFLRYRTSYEEWGAKVYVFRFSPGGNLKAILPLSTGE